MLAFNPKKRITIKKIKKHKWFLGKTLEQNELIKLLRKKHRRAEEKRKRDVRKMKDLANSLSEYRDITFDYDEDPIEYYPNEELTLTSSFGRHHQILDVLSLFLIFH